MAAIGSTATVQLPEDEVLKRYLKEKADEVIDCISRDPMHSAASSVDSSARVSGAALSVIISAKLPTAAPMGGSLINLACGKLATAAKPLVVPGIAACITEAAPTVRTGTHNCVDETVGCVYRCRT